MILVSNASPLVSLARIGRLELVRELFGNLLVPEAVWHEVVVVGSGQPGAQMIQDAEASNSTSAFWPTRARRNSLNPELGDVATLFTFLAFSHSARRSPRACSVWHPDRATRPGRQHGQRQAGRLPDGHGSRGPDTDHRRTRRIQCAAPRVQSISAIEGGPEGRRGSAKRGATTMVSKNWRRGHPPEGHAAARCLALWRVVSAACQ